MSETKEWIFFIDCDAFFTDFETSIGRLLATYSDDHADRAAAAAVQFLVAEDPGGINTGVFLIRVSTATERGRETPTWADGSAERKHLRSRTRSGGSFRRAFTKKRATKSRCFQDPMI